MKSLNNKGFMLVETLIVATFLIITLMFLYVQFNNIRKSYDQSFKYNQVGDLYNVKNIEKYLIDNGLTNLTSAIIGQEYIDITSCPDTYLTETNYCLNLLDSLNVTTVLFTNENLTNLKKSDLPFSQELQNYIQFIKYEKIAGYRLIVEYKNGTYASLRIMS